MTRFYLLKSVFLGLVFIISATSLRGDESVDPTGTYEFQGKTKKKDGDTYGYIGTIQVKKLNDTLIVMTFFICKGAPSYNSGSFADTLSYINNKAIFKDEGMIAEFSFTKKGITVKEIESNHFYWGNGVCAHGFFKKKSSKEPVLTEPLTGEKL